MKKQTAEKLLEVQSEKIKKLERAMEIEAALERVRARAMAMHNSEELVEVLDVVFRQIQSLDFGSYRVSIIIIDMQKQLIKLYDQGENVVMKVELSFIDYPVINAGINGFKEGRKFRVYKLAGEEKKNWDNYFFSRPELQDLPEEAKAQMMAVEEEYFSWVYMKHGCLQVESFMQLEDDKIALLQRFGKVLDLCYTRMLDLQKAEAQAREAQIETTLERIRAASMAMQHSDELPNVALQFLIQMEHLEVPIVGSTFGIVNEEQHTGICYFADNTGSQNEVKLLTTKEFPIRKYWLPRTIMSRIEKVEKVFTIEAKGVQIRSWIKWIKETLSEERAARLEKAEFKKVYFHCIRIHKNSSLTLSSVLPLNDDHWNTIQRMANTFILSYRRFLDLKKAEAQAKEAQIEAALERVRAASMAMHKTEDLSKVVTVLFDQLQELEIDLMMAFVGIFNLKEKYVDQWVSPIHGHKEEAFYMKLPFAPWENTTIKEWKKGKKICFVSVHGTKAIKEYTKKLDKIAGEVLFSDMPDKFAIDKIEQTEANHKYGHLSIVQTRKATKAEIEILLRFAKVFEQTYTRFLDLQKAEAQAREAQIEAALERVRAASMAMHKSEELPNVTQVLVEQMDNLKVDQLGSSIVEIDGERERYNQYSAHDNLKDDGKFLNIIRDNELTPIYFGKEILRRTRAGEKDFTIELRGEHLKEWMHYVKDNIHKERGKRMLKAGLEGVYFHFAVFHELSSVVISTRVPLPDEDRKILRRMANTFGLSYRRYLDLIRAEQQARDAEIVAALERVRSASLALHKSEELHKVVLTVSQEISSLGLEISAAHIYRFEEGDDEGVYMWIAGDGGMYPYEVYIPYIKHDIFDGIYDARTTHKNFFTFVGNKRKFNRLYRHLLKSTKIEISEDRRKFVLEAKSVAYSVALGKHSGVALVRFSEEAAEFSPEENEILKRFSKVFEQAFTRFLDLAKAEKQAREAEIEAALERVRSETMAMHQSSDLHKAASVLFEQLKLLGADLFSCGFVLCEENNPLDEQWMHSPNTGTLVTQYIPHEEERVHFNLYKAWKSQTPLYSETVEGQELEEILEFLMAQPSVQKNLSKFVSEGIEIPKFQKLHGASFSKGYLLIITTSHFPEEQIFIRFAKVFEQTYTRFLDLKKAEAQAREAQIEAALERVRAKTMAMQRSDQLAETAVVLFKEFFALGDAPDRMGIGIFNEAKKVIEMWATDQSGSQLSHVFNAPIEEPTTLSKFYDSWKKGKQLEVVDLSGQQLKKWIGYVREKINMPIEETNIKGRRVHYAAFFSSGFLNLTSHKPVADEFIQLLIRFAKVFDQTYTRFLDLKKAEAQAREAQIEVALERVRAASMAMHDSKDLHKVIVSVYNQLVALGLKVHSTSIVESIHDESGLHFWNAANGQVYPKLNFVPYNRNIYLTRFKSALENRESFYSLILTKRQKDSFFRHFFTNYSHQDVPKSRKDFIFSSPGLALSAVVGKHTALFVLNYERIPYSNDENRIIQRFAQVFEQAYTRFLDLKKAEAQAREAQIEAALERVRARSMAMHSSEDLAATVEILYDELDTLQIHPLRFGHATVNRANKTVGIHTATDLGKIVGHVKLEGHPLLEKIYDHFLRQEDLHYVLQGEELKSYYSILSRALKVPIPSKGTIQYGYFFFFEDTGNYAWSDRALNEEELKVFGRLTTVLNLTYKRYEELKNAEFRAKEALIEAALDRVRGQIASMRTTEDLQRITPLIWNELTTLGVPFIRCGVFIIDEETAKVQVYLSAPDGQALATMNLAFDSNQLTFDSVEHWRKGEVYQAYWNKEEFINWTKSMIQQGHIQDVAGYQGSANPPESLHLNFIPFIQGMLYVGNTQALNAAEIELVQSLAEAFAIAYARYEDFAKLEQAKSEIEGTLTELKSTQAQLIQSEKMASLGELTAGIAHEIQNPLNFVNNFSKVSNELLKEMEEEVKEGNKEEIKEIMGLLSQNLEKITHHGERASGIVKGMLQHSRSNTGEKEPTDINALCDEYLRLAYHGVRAKNKRFKVHMETAYDETIGKTNVIPQNIGRVLLNLISNAFYTVNERRQKEGNDYVPAVTLSTRKANGQINIVVSDNGTGIPKDKINKIFQPFFTTKPTGQGTGLGLSLSYDIVKAHGGELLAESEAGKGTIFKVVLPLQA